MSYTKVTHNNNYYNSNFGLIKLILSVLYLICYNYILNILLINILFQHVYMFDVYMISNMGKAVEVQDTTTSSAFFSINALLSIVLH